jgi:hypothetical protein
MRDAPASGRRPPRGGRAPGRAPGSARARASAPWSAARGRQRYHREPAEDLLPRHRGGARRTAGALPGVRPGAPGPRPLRRGQRGQQPAGGTSITESRQTIHGPGIGGAPAARRARSRACARERPGLDLCAVVSAASSPQAAPVSPRAGRRSTGPASGGRPPRGGRAPGRAPGSARSSQVNSRAWASAPRSAR